MEAEYAIDPSLREAEGTVHTAPAKKATKRKRKGKGDGQQAAPVAPMHHTAQDAEYFHMIPLIHAANQAQQIAHMSEQQEAGGPPAQDHGDTDAPEITPQGKRKPGRPKGSKSTTPRAKKQKKSADGAAGEGGNTVPGAEELGGTAAVDPRLDDTAAEAGPDSESRKRKERDGEKAGAEDEAAVSGEQTVKKARLDAVEDEPGSEERFKEAGPLTKWEWQKIEDVMNTFKTEHSLDQRTVNEFIQSTNRAQSALTRDLWKELYESLPIRQRVAVMRACRRRFNNFEARGKWTAEEDDLLKQSYADSPGKWVKIGATLGRMPEDCRDRWRNYLSCGDQRRIDDWTSKEEAELLKAIHECAEALQQDAKAKAKEEGHAFRERDWESEVNFNIVSEKMAFTRSRLQCYTHWKVMQNRDGKTGHQKKNEGASNRQGRALANFRKMLPGDKYQILSLIEASPAQEDEEIPWKQIARENQNNRWTTRDRKEGYLKMRADLASNEPDLRKALQNMIDLFRSRHSEEELAVLTLPVEKDRLAEQEDGDDDDEHEANGVYAAGQNDNVESVHASNSAPRSEAGGVAQMAQMRGGSTNAKKAKKARGKKAPKLSKDIISEQDEDNVADETNALEEAISSGATLAEHLMTVNTAAPTAYAQETLPYEQHETAQTEETQAATGVSAEGEVAAGAQQPQEEPEEEVEALPPKTSKGKAGKGKKEKVVEEASMPDDQITTEPENGFPWKPVPSREKKGRSRKKL